MVQEVLLVIAGLVVLLVAGDLLVRGAVGLATAMRIPTLLVSLTIVAFGTSAPELVVSIQAILSGNAGIAIGNIVGSNIANIFLVLGVPALIYPIATNIAGLRRHAVIMLLATAAFAYFAYGPGAIDTAAGFILFGGIIAFIGYMALRALKSDGDDPLVDDVSEYTEGERPSALKVIAFLVVGLVGLPIGAHLLVSNGSILAANLGMREEVIGLTIIAFGTSLPELATVVAAAFHKKSDVAIGNIIGSNIFNILAVGGATGLVGRAAFDAASLRFDLPIMIAAAIIAAAYVFTRRPIGWLGGALMSIAYIAFVIALGVQAGI